jgi:hypothetical protein
MARETGDTAFHGEKGLEAPKPMRAAAACSAGLPFSLLSSPLLSSGRTEESAAAAACSVRAPSRRAAPAAAGLRCPAAAAAVPRLSLPCPRGSAFHCHGAWSRAEAFCCRHAAVIQLLRASAVGVETRKRESGLSSPVTVLC